MSLNESIVEDAALEWFLLRRLLRQGYEGQEGCGGRIGDPHSPSLRRTGLGYAIGHEPQLAPGKLATARCPKGVS